jgi:DNA-binding MarR family transcriptional regulator
MLDIEPITLVRLLDKLEAAGLVERRPDPSDRRVRRLFLTEATGPLLEQLQELAAETRETALVGLSDAERQQLTDLLMKVRGNLSGRDLLAKTGGTETSTQNDSTSAARTANHA